MRGRRVKGLEAANHMNHVGTPMHTFYPGGRRRRRHRRSKQEIAQAKTFRKATGTCTTVPSAAGIKGRRQPKTPESAWVKHPSRSNLPSIAAATAAAVDADADYQRLKDLLA